MRNITIKFPEIAYSIGSSFTLSNNDSKLVSSEHTEDITGIVKIQDFWTTASLDKSLKLFRSDYPNKFLTKSYEILHKKKISSLCANENFLFIGDKTGEVWEIAIDRIESGTSDSVGCSRFYIGHQASIEFLWCDKKFLISVDVEYKIKVSEIRENQIVDFVLLGHEAKIVSAVHFNGKFYSCDEAGVLKCWVEERILSSVKTNQAMKLVRFGEHLLGISQDKTYVIDYIYMQVVPVKEISALLDYPHVFHIVQDTIQETKIEFAIET